MHAQVECPILLKRVVRYCRIYSSGTIREFRATIIKRSGVDLWGRIV